MKKKIIFFILNITWSMCYSNYFNLYLTNNKLNKYINKGFLPTGYELYKRNSKYILDGVLTNKQIDNFYDNGYVIINNLINSNLINKAKKINFENKYEIKEYGSIIFNPLKNSSTFLEIANIIGKAVAQLTPIIDDGDVDLHIINDKILIFNGGINGTSNGFNWHINKIPIHENSLGPGISAYVALDDIDENGGGICLAHKSHTKKYIKYRNNTNNCNELNNIIYAPQLNKGDVILLTRFLFKKTSKFNNPLKKKNISRYIINYMPSNGIVTNTKYKNITIKELNKKNINTFIKIPLKKTYSYKYNYDYK